MLSERSGSIIETDPRIGYVEAKVELSELPFYEQAAKQTGNSIVVRANEGELFTIWNIDKKSWRWIDRVIKVDQGFVGIHIVQPENQRDLSSFWQILEGLRPKPRV